MHTTEMKMLRWIQCKTISWYGQLMRREDTNVAKQVRTTKVGGKIPRVMPRLRWMDRVRSDFKQHQLDPKLAQNREAWRKAVVAIERTGIRSAKVSIQCRPTRQHSGHGKQISLFIIIMHANL